MRRSYPDEIMTVSGDLRPPLVSIVIVNLNGGELIVNCVRSVLGTNYRRFEVVVVDNGSTDATIDTIQNIIRKAPTCVKLIKNQRNLGFAEGNNVGVSSSNGKYIVFLNSDTIVDPNWLQDMVALLEKEQNIAVVQSLLLTKDGTEVDSTGGGD